MPRRSKDGYRCDACRSRAKRCADCRERKAAAVRARRAARAKAGTCIDCDAMPLPGQARCEVHAAQNNALSAAAHKRARASA